MSTRRLAAMAAGLLMTLAVGPLTLQAQDNVEADVNIVREVSTRNLLELRLADMARKKTANASVKSFAEQMRTDHLEMNKQITSLVGQNGQPFRTGLGNVDAELEEVRRLDKMSGNQFDQEFMASMIRHHQDNVSYFQSTANSAQSNQVRTLLANGLPVLRQHLNLATQVGNQVGAGPVAATGTPNVPPNVPVANPALPGSQNTPVASEQERKNAQKDRNFLVEAVQNNALEIRLAEFAQKNATYGGLRRLAARIASEHTAMQQQWLALAARHGVKLTPGIGAWHLQRAKRLEATPREDFDQTYATMLVRNNEDYLKDFQKHGVGGHSAQVRSEAAQDMPTFRQHLAAAREVGTQLGDGNLSSSKQ
jgi:putative membrane protein